MPCHPLDLIYDGKHDVQSVVGAGNADSGGLIGQDTGQAPAKDLMWGMNALRWRASVSPALFAIAYSAVALRPGR